MSRWGEDDRDRERRDYDGDVTYDVWRSGGNPDYIDRDRVRDHFYNGYSAEEAANAELRAMRPREPEPEYPEPEEQDYEPDPNPHHIPDTLEEMRGDR